MTAGMNGEGSLPARLAEIVEDFELAEGPEKLELLLEYADTLPPLPPDFDVPEADMESVPECMTPVALTARVEGDGMALYFKIPEESPTVRGFAAIMSEGLHGVPPAQVVGLPSDFYLRMGLQKVLTMQRMNGMAAMVVHIKKLAVQQMT